LWRRRVRNSPVAARFRRFEIFLGAAFRIWRRADFRGAARRFFRGAEERRAALLPERFFVVVFRRFVFLGFAFT
jgi:hypothetical protein